MRKWIFVSAVVAAIGTCWYLMRTYWRIAPPGSEPKFGRVQRGDIRVPVTAPGIIEPYQRIEIKSKASGEVMEIRVKEGDRVHAGDVLVVLKRDDEERNVARAQAGLDQAQAALENARVAVAIAQANIESARARVDELEAQAESARFDKEKTELLYERGSDVSDQELVDVRSRYRVILAQLRAARAAVTVAENRLLEAKQNVLMREAALREATKTLEDAQQRLDETTIRSRHEAIVTDVKVREGMLVQSGTTTLGGGTPVMTLADLSQLKVVARVDEADYGKVVNIAPPEALPQIEALRKAVQRDTSNDAPRTGVVKITVDAFPEDEFVGVIERVEPQGQLNQGVAIIQFDVHVRITDEKRYKLPLGAQAQVEFTVQKVEDALLVPAEAVKSFGNQRGVWIKTDQDGGPGTYGKKFIPCRFGISDGALTQVVEPLGGYALEVGQLVYTKLPTAVRGEEE